MSNDYLSTICLDFPYQGSESTEAAERPVSKGIDTIGVIDVNDG